MADDPTTSALHATVDRQAAAIVRLRAERDRACRWLGLVLSGGFQAHDPDLADEITDDLLDLAPEYLPPDGDDDELYNQWRALVDPDQRWLGIGGVGLG